MSWRAQVSSVSWGYGVRGRGACAEGYTAMCSRSEKGGAGNSQDAYIDHCSQPRDDPCPAIGITVLPTRLQLLASRPAMMVRRVGTARPNSYKSIPPIPTFFPRLLALLYPFSLATHTFFLVRYRRNPPLFAQLLTNLQPTLSHSARTAPAPPSTLPETACA